ncbi:hypothetical protein NX722_12820 [Endozoicomonas gorgoniicola]|uniref:Uncharacterized protein n=1 Tax=Endozoicomonas gorgoniicola TaxID=1234144 RepID=A0ABT3MVT7_9GAMM|nr:hypothetical protein [Endozoicomonas gorgoniicola]MCW7553490.1 hypothetical protein [Endozoicomonas gorgoniicola]
MISTSTVPPQVSFVPGSQNDENKSQSVKNGWKSWTISTSNKISNFVAHSAPAVWAGLKQGSFLFLRSVTAFIVISSIFSEQEDSGTRSGTPIPLF